MPFVVEIPWLILGLGVVVTYVVLYGLQKGYQYSLGALLRKAADIFSFKLPIVGTVNLGGIFDTVDHWVQRQIASGLLATETVLAKWWHGQEKLVEMTYDALAWFATETYHTVGAIINGHLPSFVHDVIHPVNVGLGKLGARLAAFEVQIERELVGRARSLEAELARDFGAAWRGIDHLQGSLAGSIAHALGTAEADIRAINGYVRGALRGRIRTLEQALAGGAIAAAGLFIVSRVFPWLRCTNVRSLGRAVCRLPTGLLEALLGDAIEVFIAADLCEFITLLSGAVAAFEPLLLAFVDVEDVLIGCRGITRPEVIPLDAATPPAVVGYAALAA